MKNKLNSNKIYKLEEDKEFQSIMKKSLFISIFQLIIGILTISVFIIMCITNNLEKRYIFTAILAIAFIIIGIIGIIDYHKSKNYKK